MERLTPQDVAYLSALSGGRIAMNVSLAKLSQWRIGGRAKLILCPSSVEQVSNLRAAFYTRGLPYVVFGLTSNLLFSDSGLEVPCLQLGPAMSRIRWDGCEVEVEAGTWVPGLARCIMKNSLAGAEHICGVPGTLGGLIVMNGGSQRRSISDSVVWVESVDETGQINRRNQVDCGFAYRHSIYQNNREIITRVRLRFKPSTRTKIRSEMLTILSDRRKKFPRKEPNCGSVFKSNPAQYATIGPPGAVIEQLGFKGHVRGGAQVSPRHANFIVNTGGARAGDVLGLISEISRAVFDNTGEQLEAEAIFVSREGEMIRADLASDSPSLAEHETR